MYEVWMMELQKDHLSADAMDEMLAVMMVAL